MSQKEHKYTNSNNRKKLYRLSEQGMIAGVAAGVADYFQIDVTLIRVLFVVSIFITGGGSILAYFLAAIIMPVPGRMANTNDFGERVESLAADMKSGGRVDRTRNWLGAGLVLFGAWLLLGMFWPAWLSVHWDVLWPIILIVVGLLLLARGRS